MASDNDPPSIVAPSDDPALPVPIDTLSLAADTAPPATVIHRSRVLSKPSTRQWDWKNQNYDEGLLREMEYRWREILSKKMLEEFAPVPSGVPDNAKDLPKKGIQLGGLANVAQEKDMYPMICDAFNAALDEALAYKPREIGVQTTDENHPTTSREVPNEDPCNAPCIETNDDCTNANGALRKAQFGELPTSSAGRNRASPERSFEELPTQMQHKAVQTEEQHKETVGGNPTSPSETPNAPVPKGSESEPAERRKRYRFKDVADTPESAKHDLKIDIAMYPDTEQARDAYELDKATLDAKDATRRSHLARNAWAWMTVGVEVKRNCVVAPFYFGERGSPKDVLLRDSDKGREAQCQLIKYAATMMNRQHRTHVFIISVADHYARITRWDRVGCLVSEPIDLRTDSYTLLNFVYRLGLMSDAALGFDTSAVLATKAEVAALERINHRNPYARQRAREVLDNQRFFPIYKVRCREPKGVKPKGWKPGEYFIGIHISASHSPTGRGTRGYVAFKENAKRLFFLKDYWRPSSPAVPVELAVYERLHEKGVIFIAHVDGGGDVEADGAVQHTVAQDYLSSFGKGDKRLHSRLVFVELARPLEDYQNSSALIFLLSHALRAHQGAWEAGVLHRDISVNNIMRVVNQDSETDGPVHGILNDWDLSKYRDDMQKKAAQSGRSGTWAFMSAVSLQCPYKPNDLADDLESFIHVLTWCCLRFHMHTMSAHVFGTTLNDDNLTQINTRNSLLCRHVGYFFDESWECHGGVEAGGKYKLSAAELGKPGFELNRAYVSADLITLLGSLYHLLKEHYSTLDWAELEQYKAEMSRPEVISVDPAPSATQGQTTEMEFLENDDEDGPIEAGIGPYASPALLSTSSILWPRKPLNTHIPIRQLFKQATDSILDKRNHNRVIQDDKTQDQFIGLREVVLLAPRGTSGHSSSKRKSDTSHGEQAKKMRLAGSSGYELGTVNE